MRIMPKYYGLGMCQKIAYYHVFLNMAAIFKVADTTSTERPVFRLKNVGYEVKAPNFAQSTIMTN